MPSTSTVEATASKASFGLATTKHLRCLSRELHGLLALQQINEQLAIIAFTSLPDGRCDHRAVKRNHACALDPIQQQSDVARTVDDFRILTNQVGVYARN